MPKALPAPTRLESTDPVEGIAPVLEGVRPGPRWPGIHHRSPWETDGWVCDLGARVAQPGRGGSAPARRTGPRPELKARRLPSPSNSQHQRILPWGLHRRCRWSPPSSPQPVAYPKSGWWPAPPRSPGERCPLPPDSCTLAGSLSSRCGDDARLGIGEVTLGLVVGHPRVLTTFGLFASRLRGLPHHPLPGPVATTPLPPPPTALPSPSSVGNSSPYASMRWP